MAVISASTPQSSAAEEPLTTEAQEATVATQPRAERWRRHFMENRRRRPEPAWDAPITLRSAAIPPLLRSLAQFELGDGGGPDRLIAWNAARFQDATPARRELVDLWFAEEGEHSRLLGELVKRFGGRAIRGHWSFSAFCMTRRIFGVRFELTVLLLTEIVSSAYYRVLQRHGDDPALQGVCRLILRDEAGHIAFHRDRLAHDCGAYARAWERTFRTLGWMAATMLWINHAPGMRAVGGSRREYYDEVNGELSRFIHRLRAEQSVAQGERQSEKIARESLRGDMS